MTMTNEHIGGTRLRAMVLDEEDEPAEDRDCILGPEEAIWLRLQHRRNLGLIAAGGLAFGLALALGLSAAWQIDRWAADWHYSGDPFVYAVPDRSAQPGYAE